MCIMMTIHEPASTRLINIPVIVDDKKYKLMLYTNDLNVSGTGAKGALMVVPFPNVSGCDNFGLVDVSSDKMKAFRKEVYEVCERLKPVRPDDGMLYLSDKGFNRSMKMVHEVGNYKISVANSLQELKDSINWTQFDKPDDFEEKFSTFTDKNLYPESNYCYVIAQAQVSVKNDGFGFVYPDSGCEYFPTAHECTSVGGDGNVDYDVKMYNFSRKRGNMVMFGKYFLICYNLEHSNVEHNGIIKLLDNNMVMSKDGAERTFDAYLGDHYINFFEVHERCPNGNLMIEYKKSEFKIQPVSYREKDYVFNPDAITSKSRSRNRTSYFEDVN